MIFHLLLVLLAVLFQRGLQQSYNCFIKDNHSSFTTVFRLTMYKLINFYTGHTHLLVHLPLSDFMAKVVDNITLQPNRYKEEDTAKLMSCLFPLSCFLTQLTVHLFVLCHNESSH